MLNPADFVFLDGNNRRFTFTRNSCPEKNRSRNDPDMESTKQTVNRKLDTDQLTANGSGGETGLDNKIKQQNKNLKFLIFSLACLSVQTFNALKRKIFSTPLQSREVQPDLHLLKIKNCGHCGLEIRLFVGADTSEWIDCPPLRQNCQSLKCMHVTHKLVYSLELVSTEPTLIVYHVVHSDVTYPLAVPWPGLNLVLYHSSVPCAKYKARILSSGHFVMLRSFR